MNGRVVLDRPGAGNGGVEGGGAGLKKLGGGPDGFLTKRPSGDGDVFGHDEGRFRFGRRKMTMLGKSYGFVRSWQRRRALALQPWPKSVKFRPPRGRMEQI